jgi:hypothetical protein
MHCQPSRSGCAPTCRPKKRRTSLLTIALVCLGGGPAGALGVDELLRGWLHASPVPAAVPLRMGLHTNSLVGSPAPAFRLPAVADGRLVRQPDLGGHKPVVLIFSSFN